MGRSGLTQRCRSHQTSPTIRTSLSIRILRLRSLLLLWFLNEMASFTLHQLFSISFAAVWAAFLTSGLSVFG